MRLGSGVTILLIALVAGAPARAGAQDAAALSGLDSLLGLKVSTAAKYSQTVAEAASSVSIITAEDIERYGYRTVAEALNTLSGFYFTDDYIHPKLGARGFNRPAEFNNRILLLIDGNVANEAASHAALLAHDLGLPIRSLERIEVVRGPGSVLYGGNAMFAVINLVTKSAKTLDGAEAGLQTGSHGRRGGSLLFGRRLRGGTEVTLAGEWAGADGRAVYFPEFDTPGANGGVARNLDWERRWGVFGTVRRGDVTLRARYTSRIKANPTASFGSDFDTPYQDHGEHGLLQLEYARDLTPAQHLSVRTYVNGFRLRVDQVAGGLAGAIGGGNTLGGAEVGLRWDIASANRLTAGTELRRLFKVQAFGEVQGVRLLNIDVPATIVSAYVQDEHQITRTLSVLGGVRYDHYTTFGDGVTPRGAIIYAPRKATTLKLLYGEAFRTPNLIEANLERALFGTAVALRPEKISTLELLWHQRLGSRLLGTMSVYHYQVDDLVTPVSGGATLFAYRNLGRVLATGAEIGLDARLGRDLHGYANYTYQRTTDRAADQPLSNSPLHLAKGGATFHLAPWLRSAVEARYESARRTLYGTTTDPSLLTDLHLTVGHATAREERSALARLELSLRLTNLFDVAYSAPASTEHRQTVLPQPGRTLSAELRYRF